uniref:Chitin deacetylase 6 n=1 Tax=Spodoptera exigua TaxID=7107 RepID=A0A7R6N608_SPOEX|nr:chitin deacetylase 6 [Spodoptera exigua]
MKRLALLALLLVSSATLAEDSSSEVPAAAEPCDREACKLPNCRCSGTDIPGGLTPRDTPQFVVLAFEDSVHEENIVTYRRVLYNRRNSNGCAASATFFVSHLYSNYVFVNELYNRGHEVALHSMTHMNPSTYWRDATYDVIKQEFADQRVQMSHFANIPFDSITGMRVPFLQLSGDNSFRVMSDYGLKYDNSWATNAYTSPAMWPYTLDYQSTQDCLAPPCPNASIPGVWVNPIIPWVDLDGKPCSLVHECFAINSPDLFNETLWFQFILNNFERHYFGNRAPFGVSLLEGVIYPFPQVLSALERFLDVINNLDDVFMVTSDEVIEWVKNPVPISQYRTQACRQFIPTTCVPSQCEVISSYDGREYEFESCNVCPRVYPWLGNPLGQ